MQIKSAAVTLASLYGTVPALPNESPDLEREIDEAMQAKADTIVAALAEQRGIPQAAATRAKAPDADE